MSDEAYLKLLRNHSLGVLATLFPDGRPQLTTITYAVDDAGTMIRVSVTDGRVKTKNARRNPRAALHVSGDSPWVWAVAEGGVELTPVAADPYDATVEELVEYYRSASGEHPDWDEYRQVMVSDRRLVLRLRIERLYGQV